MRISSRSLVVWLSAILFSTALCGEYGLSGSLPWHLTAHGQETPELSEEEAQQIRAAERFLTVLEKNPRRGTALDRVYGHHVEFGTLDRFLTSLSDRAAADASNGTAWMLLGLFESHRGADAAAADALRKAESSRPDDPLASYYLGQSLLRIGSNDEAVLCFERALTRKPQRADQLEIFQQLGRVHQRAQRREEALKVWQRLESLFPDDQRVLEQIAATLAEEGESAQALVRLEKLAELVKDDYRRVVFRIQAAELKIKMGARQEGLTALETTLTGLNPDSWLHRDVRRRIDEVFLRSGDQDSLVKYYEGWLANHPDDVEGMSRLARFLASSARVPEAAQWMEKALKLAPSRNDLRKAFIDQLVNDQRIPEAIRQYELMATAAPGNADVLRDWGKLVLKDKSQELEIRRATASRIWQQIASARPTDALTAAQTADLFRQSNMFDEAMALYRKAVELAPGDPQYREFLGEYYHIQKQSDEAIKTWAGMAEGPQRNAVNVARLAEVYNSFGYLDRAVAEISEACRMEPKDFILQMRSAEYHARAQKYDESLSFLAAAEKLAVNDDEHDALIRQRIEVFQSSQRMEDETAKLAAANAANPETTVADWNLLARYYEAARRWPEATDAVNSGLKRDPKSIPALTTAARIAEASGNYGLAADLNRQLAASDRRARGDHLMNVARLEAQLGRSEEALAAADELILSAPGNTDHYEFLAQLCFRLGKSTEGLEALRKAVRINPNEPHLIMALAAALADQFRADEAIEVYWRAFEKSEEIEDKTSLTQKLAPLYQQINQFEKLIERFERDRREEDKRREMTICLAQAYQTYGDIGTARQELESLLSDNTRDTNLLQHLAKLCQTSGDLEAAIGYQRQLIAIAPGHETEFPLVAMLNARGDRDEATELLVKLTAREEDPARLLKSIDSLLTQGANEAVISITEPLLSQQREDWELLYREGVAWAMLEKPEEARTRFDRILAITLPHDTLGLFATDEFKKAQAKARSENLKGNRTQAPQKLSPLQILNMASNVQRATGLANQNIYRSGSAPPVWTPREFGTARMAAYGWLLKFESDAESAATNTTAVATTSNATEPPAVSDSSNVPRDTVADVVATRAKADEASANARFDWLYVAQLLGHHDVVFNLSREMAVDGGLEEKRFFFSSIQTRGVTAETIRSGSGENAPTRSPLSAEDLDLMLACYEALKQPDTQNSVYGSSGQVIYDSNGNAYVLVGGSYVRIGGSAGGQTLNIVLDELRLAGRDAQADEMLKHSLDNAKSTTELAAAINLLLQTEKLDRLPDFWNRWAAAARSEIAAAPRTASAAASRTSGHAGTASLAAMMNPLVTWTGRLAPQEEHSTILAILDQTLDIARDESRLAIQRKSSIPRNRSSRVNSAVSRVSVIYGKENNYVQIDFPRPTDHMTTVTVTMLRQVHEIFRRNDVLGDLTTHLRKRLAAASPQDLIYERMFLASALWWAEENDEAIELLALNAEELKHDPEFSFEMADLRAARGDFDEALDVLDTIAPRDQQLLQRRELAALTLAERLGDQDRARSAAERLFGLRLDSNTQLSLVDVMRRLGMNEMAEAIIARSERQAGNQPTALASLMMLYQGQGKADQAKQIAHLLLQKTVSPVTAMASAAQNPFRYRTATDSSRTQALQVLQQTGELKSVISRLESQMQRSPDSPRLYEQLIEFYGVTNQRDKIAPLLEGAITTRPDSAALRIQYAKHLEQNNKPGEACDQYLALMKVKPDWITEDLNAVQNLFRRQNRMPELVAVIRTINFKSIRQPYYIINLASELSQNEANTDVAVELLEKIFAAFPSYRSSLISNINNPKMWQNDRMYQLGKRLVIPTPLDMQSQPWTGIDQIYSRSGNGDVSSHFHYLVRAIASTPKAADLKAELQQSVRKYPGWLGGGAMLAILESQMGEKEQARDRLTALVKDESVLNSIPADSCWLIGQELDQFAETRPLALSLFERAIAAPGSSSSQLQYSPIQKLIKVYSDSGRKQDARDMLLKVVRSATFDQYDAQYSSYQRTENSLYAAGKLLEMQFPVDAVQMYRKLLDDETTLRTAATWNGNGEEIYLNRARSGMAKAIATLDTNSASAAITQLLTVVESPKPGQPKLDLMTTSPTIGNAPASEKTPENAFDSGLVRLLVNLSADPKVEAAVTTRLQQLQAADSQDLSIAVAQAVFQARRKSPQFAESIQKLVVLTSDQPLEQIPEGRRPNSRQRKDAALSMPLWLVAREGLKDEALRAQSTQLAQRALAGARRQTGLKDSAAILLEWSQLLLQTGQKDDAQQRLTELLELSTERPKRKENDAKKEPRTGMLLHPLSPVLAQESHGEGAMRKSRPLSPVLGGEGQGEGAQRDVVNVATQTPDSTSPNSPPQPTFGHLLPPEYRGEKGRGVAVALLLNPSLLTTLVSLQVPSVTQPPEIIPPLTISQFRMAMTVAQMAADNGMSDLSRTAVREAMIGGFPVPDPETTPVNSSSMMRIVRPATGMGMGGSTSASNSQFDSEVVTSLQNVLASWTGSDYPPSEVYNLLSTLVLPASRPGEIQLYADNSRLRQAEAKSLGATLVTWAGKADKLEALIQDLNLRSQNPAVRVHALVLQIQVAMARNDSAAASMHLQELSAQLQTTPNPVLLQLACHAALPAAANKQLNDPAYAILKQAVQTPWTAPQPQNGFFEQSSDTPTGKLDEMVNRHLALTGDAESIKRYFETRQIARQAQYSRFSGDYGLNLQWQDLARFAAEAARIGAPTLAIDYLGRTVDFDAAEYSPPSIAAPLTAIVDHTRELDALQRYATWRDWTMPNKDRQTVRLVADQAQAVSVPKRFQNPEVKRDTVDPDEILCNLTELISAARAAGATDELQLLAKAAFEQKLPNADYLWCLILIGQHNTSAGQPLIQQLQKNLPERMQTEHNRRARIPWGDYVIFQTAVQSPPFASMYLHGGLESLRTSLRSISATDLLVRLHRDAAPALREQTGGTMNPDDLPRLSHWIAESRTPESQRLRQPWWIVHENQIAHLTGSGLDHLYLRYPVTGDFQFTVDCFDNPWAECDPGYGGIAPFFQQYGGAGSVYSLGGHESVRQTESLRRERPAFNTAMIESADGRLRYYLNQHLTYEETLSGTSPWLTLFTQSTSVTTFRNPRFKGSPAIPREVRLLNGDRMDGWNCTTFSEQQPRHRIMAARPQSENDSLSRQQQQEPADFNWRTVDSVLIGRSDASRTADAQSWIYYHRPLQNAETFRYEFRYVPGDSVAEPTIGRLAFLLAPDGIRTHWIALPENNDATTSIAADNRFDEAEFRRGPARLPLKDGDWNTAELTLRDNVAVLTLNDTVIFERPLEALTDTRFGIFRYQRQATEIRNAILTGDWPETLTPEIANNLLAVDTPLSPGDRRMAHAMLGDDTHVADVDRILQQAATLQPQQAIEFLTSWVLPSADHSGYRLYFQLKPAPAPADAGSVAIVRSDVSEDVASGLLCPAIELVRLAREHGGLSRLREQLLSTNTDPVGLQSVEDRMLQQRNQTAMLALVAMAAEDQKAATEALSTAFQSVAAGLPQTLQPSERVAEFLVAWEAGRTSRFWHAGADIARLLREQERGEKTRSNDTQFKNQVDGLFGLIESFSRNAISSSGLADRGADHEPTTQWQAVPYLKAVQRAQGHRPSVWRINRGTAEHLPGNTWSQLFFQSPLRGKFEITAERSTHGYREVEIGWGMHAAEPNHNLSGVRVHNMMHGMQDTGQSVVVPRWEQLAQWRIVVDDNQVTTYVNEVRIHEETFAGPPDPWVVLQSAGFGTNASIRNLQIHGTPEIPAEIRIGELHGLTGWRADTYGDWFRLADGDSNAGSSPWFRQGDELTGQVLTDRTIASRESVLTYQRPMLEDGVIEFETFYVPGEMEVHPAVGRIALLLRPDGVRRHLLTDAQFESSGLRPNNESPIDGAAAVVPLNIREWNKIRLALTGHQLSLQVNGTDVASIELTEPANARCFSLFRYAAGTQCRVRNLVYRGDWPKTLPPVDQQQLAWRNNSAFAFSDADVAETISIALQKPADLETPIVRTSGPGDRIVAQAAGTSLTLQNAKDPKHWPGLVLSTPMADDFDVTLHYSGLAMTPATEGWGVGFGIDVRLDDAQQSVVECNASISKSKETSFKSQLRRLQPDNKMKSLDFRSFAGKHGTGQLRVVRTGGEIHCLYADGDSGEFRLMESYAIGNSGVSAIAIQAKGSDNDARIDVTLTQLTIRKLKPQQLTAGP